MGNAYAEHYSTYGPLHRPTGANSMVEPLLTADPPTGSISEPFLVSQVFECADSAETRDERSPGCGAVGSAQRLGRWGRWFESSHPDHNAGVAQLVERDSSKV